MVHLHVEGSNSTNGLQKDLLVRKNEELLNFDSEFQEKFENSECCLDDWRILERGHANFEAIQLIAREPVPETVLLKCERSRLPLVLLAIHSSRKDLFLRNRSIIPKHPFG